MIELEEELTAEGLSFHSVIEVLRRHGYTVNGYYDRRIYKDVPFLMFDSRRKHYYLVEGFERFTVRLYDPNHGEVRILRFLFALFWCKYYLTICYNENR